MYDKVFLKFGTVTNGEGMEDRVIMVLDYSNPHSRWPARRGKWEWCT